MTVDTDLKSCHSNVANIFYVFITKEGNDKQKACRAEELDLRSYVMRIAFGRRAFHPVVVMHAQAFVLAHVLVHVLLNVFSHAFSAREPVQNFEAKC